jgi:hypothetical protein
VPSLNDERDHVDHGRDTPCAGADMPGGRSTRNPRCPDRYTTDEELSLRALTDGFATIGNVAYRWFRRRLVSGYRSAHHRVLAGPPNAIWAA